MGQGGRRSYSSTRAYLSELLPDESPISHPDYVATREVSPVPIG